MGKVKVTIEINLSERELRAIAWWYGFNGEPKPGQCETWARESIRRARTDLVASHERHRKEHGK